MAVDKEKALSTAIAQIEKQFGNYAYGTKAGTQS